jgi:hypothetical protein
VVATRTELPRIAVEQLARRIAITHRRAARSLRVVAALSCLIAIPALWRPGDALQLLGVTCVLGGACYLMSRRRHQWAVVADGIATFATEHPDLGWSYSYGLIEAREPGATSSVYVFSATPNQVDVAGGLAPARVLAEGSRDG